MKKWFIVVLLVMMASLVLAACGTPATEAPVVEEAPAELVVTEEAVVEAPVEPEWMAPEGALVAAMVGAAPALDGIGDEAFWADAQEIVIHVDSGANMVSTDVHIKAVYTADEVFFLVTYADPTQSFLRAPWQLNEDGTWTAVKDPDDKGGDNNLVYEDKMSFIWPINASIPNFETVGCFAACHAGEDSDAKPYGNKYTANEGEMGDIWHWKSIRNLGQFHDQYLDSTRYSADTAGAGRHSDPSESGGYVTNATEDKTGPAFTSAAVDPVTGAPGFILDSEKVEIDASALAAGSYIPGIVKSAFVGDGGDISAGWVYADGNWTIELGRLLVTGSEFDVQFEDITTPYYFGVAVFDNAQVRHAYQTGASFLVFQPE